MTNFRGKPAPTFSDPGLEALKLSLVAAHEESARLAERDELDALAIAQAERRADLNAYRADEIARFLVGLTNAKGEQVAFVSRVAQNAADALDNLRNVPISSRAFPPSRPA